MIRTCYKNSLSRDLKCGKKKQATQQQHLAQLKYQLSSSFLFCFKNCFSVSAEGLKRPTWYYRMCSLSPYGVAVGFFYDTTSRITVVVEASKPRHSNESAIFRFLLLLFCFVFFLRKLNRFIVSFFGFFFVLFCFDFQI